METKSPSKPRLGRGLSSLIKIPDQPVERHAPTPIAESRVATSPATIPTAQIHPNPHQPRRQFNDTTLSELAASIKTTGLIQPIIVRPSPSGYELIAGERRWRAAQLAGLSDIPVLIREVDSFTQAQMALVENIQREDLNPLDRAAAYQSIIDQLGLTQSELAGRLGEDRSTIANFLRLLNLTDPVRELIRGGQLSFGHAKLLAGITDTAEQKRLAGLTIERDLSVRQLENLIRVGTSPAALTSSPNQSPHFADLEKSLTQQLGLRVQLRPSSKKGQGKLIINYSSLDQFDDLLQRLNVSAPEN